MVKEHASPASVPARIGKDELNLTEFPFAMLHTRPPKNAPLKLEFKDGEKEWMVTGDPNYGLPTASDIEVYIVLMEVTRAQGFPVQVEFSRYDLVRRLGWDVCGKSYERVNLSLDRLVGVTIRTKNAFFDASMRRWSSKEAFHILERYKIMDGTISGQDQPSLFPSWIRWSPEIYANMQAGYIKSLDVNLFLSFRSAISQALYRYLDKKRYDGKPLYRIHLRTLVFEHLGMSRTYYPSEAKHKLKPAHEELIAAGFLQGVEFAPMKTQPGEEQVIYHFAPRGGPAEALPASEAGGPAPAAVTSITPAPGSPLAQRLMEAGVSRQAAQELAGTGPEECLRQLDYLPFREARDPGAVLAKSIREGWSAPPGWTQAQQERKAVEQTRRKRAEGAAQAEQRASAEAEFERWWEALPEARRAAVLEEAAAELRRENKVLADFAARHPDSPIYRDALRPYLKRLSGWGSKDVG
jgi:hypothetical protein